MAFALFITAIVFACATISNDNLQDLKTGQLVGASPMRQQIALIVGVGAGAAVIPSVLNLLAKAYGFAGAANVGVVAPNPLPAPQATLISALAQGVIGGNLDWKMIGIGALVGVGLILLDATLGAMNKLRIPPLAVGIGIYLPMSATFAVVVGAVISHWYDGRARTMPNPERAERLGTLVASGLIVGESIWGVINAGLIVALSKDAPIGLVPEDFAPAPWLGLLGVRRRRSCGCTAGCCESRELLRSGAKRRRAGSQSAAPRRVPGERGHTARRGVRGGRPRRGPAVRDARATPRARVAQRSRANARGRATRGGLATFAQAISRRSSETAAAHGDSRIVAHPRAARGDDRAQHGA